MQSTETNDAHTDKFALNVGSRNSQLAIIQTKIVIERLTDYYRTNVDRLRDIDHDFRGGINFNIVGMTTEGDRILDKPLPDIGAKSLFTKDLEVALLDNRVDLIVHSLKDLPTTLPQGCVIGAILKRDDPDDALVLKKSLWKSINPIDLIFGSQEVTKDAKTTIGTSSLRRISMLKRCNPGLRCACIRGNLNTRLRKLDEVDGEYSAIILAKAGLDRMGWENRASAILRPESDPRLKDWCHAVGQGAIAVECREDDRRIIDILSAICDLGTIYETIAERSLMKHLEGGCSVPLGVRSSWSEGVLKLKSVVTSIDGESIVEASNEKSIIELEETDREEADSSGVSTTGVAISSRMNESNLIRRRMIACSKLGVIVANKMIELGCQRLMRAPG